MCVVSMVTDHYYHRWPSPEWDEVTFPSPQQIPSLPPSLPTPEEYNNFLELVRKAREYDKRTNQPDCPDAEKLKWMDELEKRMVEKYGLQPQNAVVSGVRDIGNPAVD